jgi:hypothetical protein
MSKHRAFVGHTLSNSVALAGIFNSRQSLTALLLVVSTM